MTKTLEMVEGLPLLYLPGSMIGGLECRFSLLIDAQAGVAIMADETNNMGAPRMRAFIKTPDMMFRVWCDCCCRVNTQELELIQFAGRKHNFMFLLLDNPLVERVGHGIKTQDIATFFKSVAGNLTEGWNRIHQAFVLVNEKAEIM